MAEAWREQEQSWFKIRFAVEALRRLPDKQMSETYHDKFFNTALFIALYFLSRKACASKRRFMSYGRICVNVNLFPSTSASIDTAVALLLWVDSS